MTLTEFLERLRETPRDWRLNNVGQIRVRLWGECHCPVTAIRRVASGDELPISTRREVIWAADNYTCIGNRLTLRKALLEAVGLEES